MRKGVMGIAVCCLLAALAAAGCSDEEPERQRSGPPKYSMANEPPDTFAKRVAKLVETSTTVRDCTALETVNARSLNRLSCPASRAVRRSMRDFEIVGQQEFGTGAIVDYRSGDAPDGATIVLYVARSREWAISRFGVVTPASSGTDDSDTRTGFAEAASTYLAAVRDRDCDAFMKVAVTPTDDKAVTCRTTFAATKPLARRLRAEPGAEPRYQGGNERYGFFALEMETPADASYTIGVVKAPGDTQSPYLVVDAVPGLSLAQHRAALRLRERQRTIATETTSGKKID